MIRQLPQTRPLTGSIVSRHQSAETASIVICTYTKDRLLTLQSAIDATRGQMSHEDELLVIVDHNEPLLAQCRASLNNCIVISNKHNRGLSGARNTAIEEASGSIVVFIDDDAVPFDGWLDALRVRYADKRVYGVGGLTAARWLGGRPRWFPAEFLWVVGCSHRGLPSRPGPVRNLTGANMSFRVGACRELGGFDETMGRVGDRPVSCEETEFSIRLTQANPDAILWYDPSAQAEHYLARQRSSLAYFIRRCWAEGVSKVEVSRRVGRSSALSTELDYVLRVLPSGIWRGLRDVGGGDLWGTARAAMIVVGLATTSVGYCAGAVRRGGPGSEAK
jgi:glycosyltransferase involved in cell wall biosynthesis